MSEPPRLPETPQDAELVPERGAPVGRRIVLGAVGLGALGILLGSRIQAGMEDVLRPITLRDRTGLSDLLPATGRFRYYSVTGRTHGVSDADYRLVVDGLVERPVELGLDDLRRVLPQSRLTRDFQCVTGWRVREVPWKGVALGEVLDRVGVQANATHVMFHSFDGVYTESLTLEQARRPDVLVAHELQGRSVTAAHGGPVRLYVAPMYGYKSCKWLGRIEVVDHLEDHGGYWERRGYSRDAWVGRSNGRRDTPIESDTPAPGPGDR